MTFSNSTHNFEHSPENRGVVDHARYGDELPNTLSPSKRKLAPNANPLAMASYCDDTENDFVCFLTDI